MGNERPDPSDNTNRSTDANPQNNPLREEYVARENTQAGRDGRPEVQRTNNPQTVDPYELLQAADRHAGEIVQLNSKNKWDRIQVRDEKTGQLKEVTVEARLAELKTAIKEKCELAIGAADAIKQDKVMALLQENAQKLDPKAAALGYDARTLSTDQMLLAKARQAGLDPARTSRQQLEAKLSPQEKELYNLVQEKEIINRLRNAPSLTRVFYAALKADGMADPTGQNTQKEMMDSFALLNEAGRLSTEAQYTPMYQETMAKVAAGYAQGQQERQQQMIKDMQEASQLASQGNNAEAGKKWEAAYKAAEQIDYKFLAAQLRDPRNANNPEVANQLVAIIQTGYQARTNYAKYLNSQGKFDEALPIALKAGADTPEFAQQDQSYGKVVNDAMFGKKIPAGDLQAAQMLFQKSIENKDFTEAEKQINFLKKNYQDTQAQLEKGAVRLREEETRLKQQMDQLKTQQLVETQKQIEQARLQKELEAIQGALKTSDEFGKQWTQIQYLGGILAYAKGDNKEAHALFEEVKKNSPEIANNPEAKIDDLLEETRDKGFWERNWGAIKKGLCIGLAVLAGVAVGALTIWSGPGAAVFGAGTTAALLTTMGIATVGGVAAGGAVGWTADTTMQSIHDGEFKPASFRDTVNYGIAGGAGALTVASGPLFAGMGATSKMGIFATTRALPGLTFGLSKAGGDQAAAMIMDGKGFNSALKDFALEGTMNSALWMMPGMSMGPNAVTFGKEVGTKSLKEAMLSATVKVGKPLVAWEAGMPTAVNMGINGYLEYSPYRAPNWVPVLGNPALLPEKTRLDPNNKDDEREIWRRYYSASQ